MVTDNVLMFTNEQFGGSFQYSLVKNKFGRFNWQLLAVERIGTSKFSNYQRHLLTAESYYNLCE
jgi:hypothetical protein